MPALFFKIDKLPLMIIPDLQLKLDEENALTHIYNIYVDCDQRNPAQRLKKDLLTEGEKLTDPDYFGCIAKRGSVFTYIANGENKLKKNDVEELVEIIRDYKTHTDLWQQLNYIEFNLQ